MQVEERSFHSHKLNREMSFRIYGHGGKPVLVFPSSGGRYFEYEDFRMIEACREFIDQGLIQIYTLDSIDNDTWLNKHKSPEQIGHQHNLYDAYVVDEFVPFVRRHSRYPVGRMMVTGCSMGAYHSANFYFKHPDLFDILVALSGIYSARYFVGDNLDKFEVYVNSPIDYLANLEAAHYLEQYRQGKIIICTGQGAWETDSVQDTRDLEAVLGAKSVPAWFDYWGYDVAHDWPWWQKQIAYFLDKLRADQWI